MIFSKSDLWKDKMESNPTHWLLKIGLHLLVTYLLLIDWDKNTQNLLSKSIFKCTRVIVDCKADLYRVFILLDWTHWLLISLLSVSVVLLFGSLNSTILDNSSHWSYLSFERVICGVIHSGRKKHAAMCMRLKSSVFNNHIQE